jgi:hypothetical protein
LTISALLADKVADFVLPDGMSRQTFI